MPDGGELCISARAARDGIEIEVADTGPGIDEATLARILEPLYTTKARGLGLGLAIARAIIERHGGSLEVHSRPGAGSRFTVRLLTHPVDDRKPE
jgi:signal transduction histidine kinase